MNNIIKLLKIGLLPLFSLIVFLGFLSFVNIENTQAQTSCPNNTVVDGNNAVLVGEVTDDGGDPNLTTWFKYGKSSSGLLYQTAPSSKYGVGTFCFTIQNLEPCVTYNYQAVSKNSAGTAYGETKSFNAFCPLVVSANIKANNSNGPVTLNYKETVTLSWTSQNATSCTASGDWSGDKANSGSQDVELNQAKNHTFTITCRNEDGSSAANSVQVKALPLTPTVITKPAVVTY
jgi:hypothetical protein